MCEAQKQTVLWPRAERVQGRVLRPPGQARPQADAAPSAGKPAPSAERGAGEAADACAAEPGAGPGSAAAGEPGAAAGRRSAESPAGALSDAPNGIAHEAAAAAPLGHENALDPGSSEAPGAADEPVVGGAERAPAAADEAASAPAADAARSAAGTLAYLDASGKERRASFAPEQAAQPDAGPGGNSGQASALAPGDDVEFSVVVDRRTGNVRAEDVRLIRRARRRLPAQRRAELQCCSKSSTTHRRRKAPSVRV